MSDRPIGSVLIPAHNEEAVIGRRLDHLFDGIDPASLEVAVVCNGCHDGTAAAARASGHPVQVIELDVASKPAALGPGTGRWAVPTPLSRRRRGAAGSQRTAGARAPRAARRGGGPAADSLRHVPLHRPSRRYFRARAQMPSVMGSLWGAGVYGLTAAGRARFGDHPDVVAEDHWVDQHFDAAEIDIVGDEPVVVVAPARVRDLLKVRRRAYRGVVENGPPSRAAGAGQGDDAVDPARPAATLPHRAGSHRRRRLRLGGRGRPRLRPVRPVDALGARREPRARRRRLRRPPDGTLAPRSRRSRSIRPARGASAPSPAHVNRYGVHRRQRQPVAWPRAHAAARGAGCPRWRSGRSSRSS